MEAKSHLMTKNGLDWKNSWAGNYNSYLYQSQSVQEFYCCKQQKANMANVNQREFIKAGWGHRVEGLTELRGN